MTPSFLGTFHGVGAVARTLALACTRTPGAHKHVPPRLASAPGRSLSARRPPQVRASVASSPEEEGVASVQSVELTPASAHTHVGLQVRVLAQRAITLSLLSQPHRTSRSVEDPEPRELLWGQLSAQSLAEAYLTRRAASFVVQLSDEKTQRGALLVSVTRAGADPAAAIEAVPSLHGVPLAQPPAGSPSRSLGGGAWGGAGGRECVVAGPRPPLARAAPVAPEGLAIGLAQFEKKLWRAFVAADVSGDGLLSQREVYDALAAIGLRGSSADQLKAFCQIGADTDGYVRWDRFLRGGLRLRELSTVDERTRSAAAAYRPPTTGSTGEPRSASRQPPAVSRAIDRRPSDREPDRSRSLPIARVARHSYAPEADMTRAALRIQTHRRGQLARQLAETRQLAESRQRAAGTSSGSPAWGEPPAWGAPPAGNPGGWRAEHRTYGVHAPTYSLMPPSASFPGY